MSFEVPPISTPAGRNADQIRLIGITAAGSHGVTEAERAELQPFTADVVVHTDAHAAAAADDIAQTVDYAKIAVTVHDILAGPSAHLIETLAERIAAAALANPGVLGVDVQVHKPRAPLPVPVQDTAIAIRRLPIAPEQSAPYLDDAGVNEPGSETEIRYPPQAATPEPSILVAGEPAADVPVADAAELDLTPSGPVEVVLALGANQGDAKKTLRAVIGQLDYVPGVQVTAVSPLVRTNAVGGPPGQPDFLNAVVIIETTLSPRDLLAATNELERAHGRIRTGERDAPRTLDIDLIAYADLVAADSDLTIPHPAAGHRAFVLVPWSHIQPDAILPGLGGGPIAALAEIAPDRDGIRWIALDWLTDAASQAPELAPAAAGRSQSPASARSPGSAPRPVAEPTSEPGDDASAVTAAAAQSAERQPPSWDEIIRPSRSG